MSANLKSRWYHNSAVFDLVLCENRAIVAGDCKKKPPRIITTWERQKPKT